MLSSPFGFLRKLPFLLKQDDFLYCSLGASRTSPLCSCDNFWLAWRSWLLIEAALRQRAGGDQPPSRLSSTQKCGCYWDDGLRGEMDQWETNIRLEPTGLYGFVWRVEMDKSCSSTATVQSMLRTPASCAHVAASEWAFFLKREMKLSSKSDLFVSSFPWKSEN